MEFCIRNFLCHHTQQLPGPIDNIEFGKRCKVPVFHVYGVTDTGKKACLHIHGFFPYLILRVGGTLTQAVYHAMRSKINRLVHREIELSTGNSSKYQNDYVYRMEAIRSRSMYGYYEEDEEFVKIYFSSPWYAQKATRALGREALNKSVFQPFEAHLPFHLQFFIDNSIFGMDNIYLKKVKFRIKSTDSDDDIVYKNLTISEVKQNSEYLSPHDKSTNCVIECDAHFSDILNVEMHSKNVYSSNPGLEYIWREEHARCEAQGIELVDIFNSYEARKSTTYAQEREMLRKVRQLAKKIRNDRNMPEDLDDLMETRICDTQTSSMDVSVWENDGEDYCEQPIQAEENAKSDNEEEEIDDENFDDEAEMTMIAVNPEKEVENKAEDDCLISSDEEVGENNEQEKLQWITAKSAYRQRYISGIGGQVESRKGGERSGYSREMTSCSAISENTIVGNDNDEATQIQGPSLLLSQTSIDIVGLCVASLELLIKTSRPMPDVYNDPVIGASIAIYNDICRESTPNIHAVYTSVLKNGIAFSDSRCIYIPTEYGILEQIARLIVEHDVDILIGYDLARLSWGYLMKRSRLIGMNVSMDRYFENQYDDREVECPQGRIMVAVWKMVRSDLALRNYDLGTAMAHVLRRKLPILDNAALTKRIEINNDVVNNDVYTYLLKLSRVNISLLIEMNWFLRNSEMARVYGIQFHEVWTRGSQLRVESMLLRLAHRMNFVAPSVTPAQRNQKVQTLLMTSPEQIQLILEPLSNVYFDPVIVLDFQSLYPSMVIAHNYCYSTIIGKIANLSNMTDVSSNYEEIVLGALRNLVNKENLVSLVAHKNIQASPVASLFVKKSKREGVLPILLREILAARIMIKNAMKRVKSKQLKRILDARQLALKLVANVSYGYTAANWSGRMPCAELADAILGKGRETLEKAIEIVKTGSYGGAEIIYGDTDSIFVLVPGATLNKAFEIGRQIVADVTNSNPDPVVLKLEKVYQGCVLETKKRYAGWMFEHENDEGKFEAKGIETVRRDTCPIVSEVLQKSLELIFVRRWKAFGSYLNQIAVGLPKLNFSKFVFCKEFRGDYSKNAMVPQKKIAENRLRQCKSYETLRGERVPYLIVEGPPGSTVYSCVRSLDEFSRNSKVKINVQYYLNSHILAALRRVTDLLPMKIVTFPLMANQCFSNSCSRLGQTPWCIQCQRSEPELCAALVDLGRHSRAKKQIREICKTCQSWTNRIDDENIKECRNFSCLVRQTFTILERADIEDVVRMHSLNRGL